MSIINNYVSYLTRLRYTDAMGPIRSRRKVHMRHLSDGAMHLQGATFKISYPPSPFYPSVPVFAQFSGVLTGEGQLHVKLDAGSIPGTPVGGGIPIRGSFSVGPDETPLSYSGVLSDNRIKASVRMHDRCSFVS